MLQIIRIAVLSSITCSLAVIKRLIFSDIFKLLFYKTVIVLKRNYIIKETSKSCEITVYSKNY